MSFKLKPSNFMSDFSTNLPFSKWFCIFPFQLWTPLLWCIFIKYVQSLGPWKFGVAHWSCFVTTLALGSRPRQRGCKVASQEEAREPRQKGYKVAGQEEAREPRQKGYKVAPRGSLRAKAKRPQGCEPRGSPRVTSHTPGNVRKCEGVWRSEHSHSQGNSHFGRWSPGGLLKFQRAISRAKTYDLWHSLYHWKALGT